MCCFCGLLNSNFVFRRRSRRGHAPLVSDCIHHLPRQLANPACTAYMFSLDVGLGLRMVLASVISGA
jgi:hypothetical protein